MKRCQRIVGRVGAIKLHKVVIPAPERGIIVVAVITTLRDLVTLALPPVSLVVAGGMCAPDVVPVLGRIERSVVEPIGDQGPRDLDNRGATARGLWLPSRESAP